MLDVHRHVAVADEDEEVGLAGASSGKIHGSQPPKITLAWRSIAATVSPVVSSGPRPAGIRTQGPSSVNSGSLAATDSSKSIPPCILEKCKTPGRGLVDRPDDVPLDPSPGTA